MISNGRLRVYLEDLVVAGADSDGLSTVKTAGLNRYFPVGKQPANRQHLHPSLAVPFLDATNADQEVSWNVAERSPRLYVISVMGQPTSLSRSGTGGGTLKLTSLIHVNTNGIRKLGVMRSSPGRHEVLHNRGEDNLCQRIVCHTRLSMSFQIVLKAFSGAFPDSQLTLR